MAVMLRFIPLAGIGEVTETLRGSAAVRSALQIFALLIQSWLASSCKFDCFVLWIFFPPLCIVDFLWRLMYTFLLPSIVPCHSSSFGSLCPQLSHENGVIASVHRNPFFFHFALFFGSYLFSSNVICRKMIVSKLSRCLSHSYFCGLACEKEQIVKILFPRQVDVMKRLIPVMMGLRPATLWFEVLVVSAVQLQKNCLAMSPMTSPCVILTYGQTRMFAIFGATHKHYSIFDSAILRAEWDWLHSGITGLTWFTCSLSHF